MPRDIHRSKHHVNGGRPDPREKHLPILQTLIVQVADLPNVSFARGILALT